VYGYRFVGVSEPEGSPPYWRDIGLLDSFYEANMDLVDVVPALDLYNPDWPIRTYHDQVPPTKVVRGPSGSDGTVISSLVADGCIISGGRVEHSILSPSVVVSDRAEVNDSILMDRVRVGAGSRVRKAILDKGVSIPDGVDMDTMKGRFPVTEKGVVVVPKGTPGEVFLGR